MNKKIIASFVFLGAFLVPGIIGAATFEGGEAYLMNTEQVVEDNLYIGGGDVTVGGTVQGDLLVAGGMVVVSGNVQEDIAIAGGNILVTGLAGGDTRIVGGDILVSNSVGGDLAIAGGTIKVLDTVTVGKDVSLAGGYMVFSGTTKGDATFAGGEIIIDGKIDGDVEVFVGEKLTLGENAEIGGSLLYHAGAKENLVITDGAVVVGATTFEESKIAAVEKKEVEGMFAAIFGGLIALKLISVAIVALIAVLVFRRFSLALAQKASESFWMQMLRGFIVLIMIPISAIILLVTVFGYYLGLILLVLYSLILMLSTIYSGVIFGALTVKLWKKESSLELTWMHALLGVIVLYLIKLIPVVGWIIGFAFVLVVIGSLFQLFREKVWNNR